MVDYGTGSSAYGGGGGGREKCPIGVQVLTAAQCLLEVLQIHFLLVLDDCVLCHIGHLYLKK